MSVFLLTFTYLYQRDFQNCFIRFLFGSSLLGSSLLIFFVTVLLFNIGSATDKIKNTAPSVDVTLQMLLMAFIINLMNIFVCIQFFEFSRTEKERLARASADTSGLSASPFNDQERVSVAAQP